MTNNTTITEFVKSFNYFYLIFVPSDKANSEAYKESIVELTYALSADADSTVKDINDKLATETGVVEGTYLLIPLVGRMYINRMHSHGSWRTAQLCGAGVISTEYGILKGIQEWRGKIEWSLVDAGEANKVSGSETPFLPIITIAEDSSKCKY